MGLRFKWTTHPDHDSRYLGRDLIKKSTGVIKMEEQVACPVCSLETAEIISKNDHGEQRNVRAERS